MATPTITFNSSTGSDSQASGAGPATALFGTAASYSGSVVTLDGSPDLSGVATDGSAVLWLQTSTGRRNFTINAVDNGADTVTLDDAPAGTATGLTWAIGGKRGSFDLSRQLFSDLKAGWIVETETNQAITTTTLSVNSGGSVALRAIIRSNNTTVRVIDQAANDEVITLGTSADHLQFEYLQFTNTNGTKTTAHGVAFNGNSGLAFIKCIFGHATNTLNRGITRAGSFIQAAFVGCEFRNCAGDGISTGNNTSHQLIVQSCYFHDNGGDGIVGGTSAIDVFVVSDSIFDTNVSGIDMAGVATVPWIVRNCTFYGHSGNAFDNIASAGLCYNNIFANNTGRGISADSTITGGFFDYNAFYSNTAGHRENISAGANDVDDVDPDFVNAAGGDFTPQATELIGTGFEQ